MSLSEYRKNTIEELKELLASKRNEMEKTSFDILKKKEKNVKKMGFMRKDIARINTVIKEKEREGQDA